MKVRDIMSTELITVNENTDIHSLARLLTEARISGCPVVDDRGQPVGVVSLHDLVRRQGEVGDSPSAYWQGGPGLPRGYSLTDVSPSTVKVGEIMTPACYSIDEMADLVELCEFFLKGEIHRVLVTRHDKLVGIVTSTDIIRVLHHKLAPVSG